MARLQFLCLSLLALCAVCWNPVQGVAVMSVDFGSEWMKIAIVSVCYKHTYSLQKAYYNIIFFSREYPWK